MTNKPASTHPTLPALAFQPFGKTFGQKGADRQQQWASAEGGTGSKWHHAFLRV